MAHVSPHLPTILTPTSGPSCNRNQASLSDEIFSANKSGWLAPNPLAVTINSARERARSHAAKASMIRRSLASRLSHTALLMPTAKVISEMAGFA